MTDLVATIGKEDGALKHVEKLVEGEEWENVYFITSPENKKNCPKGDIIVVDNKKVLSEMVEEIKNKLDGKISIMETAVNVVSGNGKEHMALISALLKLGCGIRLIALTKQGIMEI